MPSGDTGAKSIGLTSNFSFFIVTTFVYNRIIVYTWEQLIFNNNLKVHLHSYIYYGWVSQIMFVGCFLGSNPFECRFFRQINGNLCSLLCRNYTNIYSESCIRKVEFYSCRYDKNKFSLSVIFSEEFQIFFKIVSCLFLKNTKCFGIVCLFP